MEDVESRYAYLLQPIRDITKNWEVDVASQLGEYLEELDQICISFDGGKTTMNFAEAALLIQGSACIYSKKVEYLYTLVYQALDSISNKKRDQQPASVGADGVDKDANFPNNEEEQFLDLDDIGEAKKTNIDVKDQNTNPVNIVPLTPMALVPPEEGEKKMNPLCSRKGEIIGSRKDYRMNSCTPYSHGLFLLELEALTPTQFKHSTPFGEDGVLCQGVTNAEQAPRSESMEEDCAAPVAVLNFEDNAPAMIDGGDDFVPLNDHHEDDDMELGEHIERQQIRSEERGYVLRQIEVKEAPVANIREIVLDPWRLLDPYSELSLEDKPFKKGNYYRLPRGVTDVSSNKRKRKLPCKLQDFQKWFSATYWDGAESVKCRRKGPTFADLDALYWKHTKKRLASQRQLQKRMGPVTRAAELFAEEEPANHLEEPREDDYLDHEDCADLSDHEDLDQNVPAILTEGPAGGNIEPIENPEHLSYEELVRQNVELFIANSQKYAQETVLSLRVREWEDKMGPALQEQDERGTFDFHDYGDRLVSQFNQVGEWRTFASLMAHKEPFEVCRYMLASLQLANDYTVEVSQKPGLQEGVDTMALRLLSQQRAHERFKTYTAPSLTDK